MNARRMAVAASQPAGVAEGRKPIAKARARTRDVAMRLRATEAKTWPVRIWVPPMSRERKRSMMPPLRSSVTAIAVFDDPKPAQRRRTPGTTYMTYDRVSVLIAPPKK